MKSTWVVGAVLLCQGATTAAVAEEYSLPQLCASYDREEALLTQRLRDGSHHWETQRILDQIHKLQQDRATDCKGVVSQDPPPVKP